MKTDFCSVNFANDVEGLFGTVPLIDRLFLLEYNSPWSDHPIETNNLTFGVNQFLRECVDKKIFSRIFFIKNNSSRKDVINCFAVNSREVDPFTSHFTINTYDELPGINIEHYFEDTAERFEETVYLVCTNGKTDKCCAKFGLPVFKKLSIMEKNVWQCTHITGCRFAPNIVTTPYLHYYGHLSENDVPELIKDARLGLIYIAKYRGRTCYSNQEQAAEYFLRNFLKEKRADSLVLKQKLQEGNLFAYIFSYVPDFRDYTVKFTCSKSLDKFALNCAGTSNYIDEFSLVSIIK